MASAERIPEVTAVVSPEGVRLDLSIQEAKTLVTILSKIGGSPLYSARKHTDAIADALTELGFSWEEVELEPEFATDHDAGSRNAIFFADYDRPARKD